jgi:tetratricopeptide (TPR) repeat protein
MKLQTLPILIALMISTNIFCQDTETELQFKDNIDEIFTRMELQGIKTNSRMLYGYFFYGQSKKQLEKLGKELSKENYEIVRLEELKEEKTYILHIQKIEIQSRETLRKTKEKFRLQAKKYKVEYDGWDVGSKNPKEAIMSQTKFIKYLENLSDKDLFINSKKLYNLDDYSNALIGFDICVQRKIKVDTSLFCLSNCLIEIGEIKSGLETFKKVIEINPKYEKALFNIATISYDLEKIDDSIKYYTKVIEVNPKRDEAFYGVAAGEYIKGNQKKAKKYCQRALEINPNNTLAQELIKWIK